MRFRLLGALMGLSVVVSACAAGTATGTPIEEDFVSFSIRLTSADADFLALAEGELISRCMVERGFKYEVVNSPVDPADRDRRYRLPNGDVGTALTDGYGLREGFEQPAGDEFSDQPGPSDANGRHLGSLTTEQQKQWMESLHGTGTEVLVTDAGEGIEQYIFTDGCIAVMEATLYGDLEEFVRITGVMGLAGADVYQRVATDPQWTNSLGRWQSCMADRGHVVADLEDPIAQASDAYRSGMTVDMAQAREIEIATDDAQCATQARLGEVYESLIRRYETEYASDHEADLTALQELQQKALAEAKALLVDR